MPSCSAALLGPLETEPPLNERNDYGWPPLVARIAARYAVGEGSVVVAAGTSMANHLAMATILETGDHVLVERPGYDPLERVPALWGAHVDHVARVADCGYRFDVDAIRAAVTPRTRLVVLSDLHNPTGARLDAADFRALTALAESRGFHVIVDEVYGEWLREEGVPSTIHASPNVDRHVEPHQSVGPRRPPGRMDPGRTVVGRAYATLGRTLRQHHRASK